MTTEDQVDSLNIIIIIIKFIVIYGDLSLFQLLLRLLSCSDNDIFDDGEDEGISDSLLKGSRISP